MTEKVKTTEKHAKPESAAPAYMHGRQLAALASSQRPFKTPAHPQMAGNLAVQRLLKTGAPQAKLNVSQPGNSAEQEADRGAENLSARPSATIQRKCAACAAGATCPKCEEEQRIQPKEKPGHTPSVSAQTTAQIAALRGRGQPLPPAVRSFFEPRFGRDFSQVRVHSDNQAAETADALSARAFTTGQDMVFGAGNYAPETLTGSKLLAHELTHVVQQRDVVQLEGGVGEAGDPYEQQADSVATAVAGGQQAAPLLDGVAAGPATNAAATSTAMQRAPVVQRDGEEGHASETKPEFAARVRERAATRLTQNMGVLDQWSTYVSAMEGFQLRAQLLTQTATSFATTAAPTPGGRQRFEDWAGTRNPSERSFLGSQLDVESTYRERVGSFFGYLTSMSVAGYDTTPSVAEDLQVLVGDRPAQPQPSVHVGADPRYSEYAPTMRRIQRHEIGGCQACHEINLAWQRTAEQWGSPLPRGDFWRTPALSGEGGRQPGASSLLSPSTLSGSDRDALLAYLQSTSPRTTAPASQPTTITPSAVVNPQQTTTSLITAPTPNPFVPSLAIPRGVDIPPPRTDLCGELPSAADSERIPSLAAWGPNSEIVASIIVRIDSVLTPLGPRGYRVLPRQNFDALYAMSPDNMQSVRDGIIARINDRKQQYNDLRAEIQGGEVPYEELCPIVDELLPTTNTFVRWQALDDVRRWQQRERLLQLVELILLALTIMFPPAAVVTIPAGMILGLIRVSLGVNQQRQGRQWTQGIGSGVYSLSQEAEAPGLAERGQSNIISGAFEFGLSAFSVFRMISEARATTRLLQALQGEAVITHAQFPGRTLLFRNGRFLAVDMTTGEIWGYGIVSPDGRLWYTGFSTPLTYGGGAYGAATGTSLVPYGSSSIVPFGAPFGGSSIVPFGGGQLGGGSSLAPFYSPLVLSGPRTPWLLPGPQTPLLLPGPVSPLLLPGSVGPIVDPGGRGLYALSETQIARLPATDAARLRALQVRMPASEAELAELVALRERAAGTELSLVPGTPEHMLNRWRQYLSSPRASHLGFQQWAAGHPSRMANSVVGPATEETYRAALAQGGVPSRSAVVLTPSGQRRQVDVLIERGRGQGRDLIQIKAGSESLTTAPRRGGGASLGSSSLSNEAALAADAEFVAAGDRVTWVLEESPSRWLVARAREVGVDVIIRVDDAAGQARMANLMRLAGMPQDQINSVTIFIGTRDELVADVARRFGAR